MQKGFNMSNPNFTPEHSTYEIWRNGDTTRCLEDDLVQIESDIEGKAASNHTHTQYSETTHTHTGFASSEHTHTGYASSEHSHDVSDVTGLETTLSTIDQALEGKASSTHTHSEYASSTHGHTGYANSDHTHSGYANAEHSHTGYALSSHTHDYAASDHNHDSVYFPKAGGTISGDTTISGELNMTELLRVNGQQALYDSGTNLVIGTNNRNTIIACASDGSVTLNGNKAYVPNLYPVTHNAYPLGATNKRFTTAYLVSQPNVSSDERLKKNIKPIDGEVAGEFIKELPVVEYQYKDDKDEDKRIGLIAQEVIKANPEFAKYFVEQDEKGFYSMTPGDLVFPLILAVQALQKEVEELKSKK